MFSGSSPSQSMVGPWRIRKKCLGVKERRVERERGREKLIRAEREGGRERESTPTTSATLQLTPLRDILEIISIPLLIPHAI